MPFLPKDALLKEYLYSNESWGNITGGSKCSWDSKNSKLLFQNNKPYYLCIFFGIVFGISSYSNSFKLAFGNTENREFQSIAVMTICGTLSVHFTLWSYLKYQTLFEALFNNLLNMDTTIKGENIYKCLKT